MGSVSDPARCLCKENMYMYVYYVCVNVRMCIWKCVRVCVYVHVCVHVNVHVYVVNVVVYV